MVLIPSHGTLIGFPEASTIGSAQASQQPAEDDLITGLQQRKVTLIQGLDLLWRASPQRFMPNVTQGHLASIGYVHH